MQFQVNRVGLDEVTLSLETTGSNESEISLKVPLLDDKREYSFCVDRLMAPLNHAPINNLKGSELFRIERRNVGASSATNIGFAPATGLITDATGIFTVTRDFYDVTSVVSALNNFARGFEIHMTLLGIAQTIGTHFGAAQAVTQAVIEAGDFDPDTIEPLVILPARDETQILADGVYKFLSFKLGTDGTLEVFGTTSFWNNFVFNFTIEGAEALGFSSSIKSVDHGLFGGVPLKIPQVSHYLGFTQLLDGSITNEITVGLGNGLLVNAGVGILDTHFAHGNMTSSNSIFSEHSLFQCLDNRLKITVSSHLPTVSNVAILNERETVDRSICEVYFTKDTRSSLTFDEEGIFKSSTIQTTSYTGDYPLIKKSSLFKQWTKLTTAYEIRFFRFHIFIWYRKFNRATEVWEITKKDLKIPETRSWNMLLRFVSEV